MYSGPYRARLAMLKDGTECHYNVAKRAISALQDIQRDNYDLFNELCRNPNLKDSSETPILTEAEVEILKLSKKKNFKLRDLFSRAKSEDTYRLTSPFLAAVKGDITKAKDAAFPTYEYNGPHPDYGRLRR